MKADGGLDLDSAIDAALARRPEASALACVDAGTGIVLASAARDAEAMDALESGAAATTMMASVPRLAGPPTADDCATNHAMIVSDRWVQVHERVPGRPALFVVGVADAGANIGLLASCVRDVSRLLGARA